MGKMSMETYYLYANPSFIGGMAKTLDMGGMMLFFNESATSMEADAKAISNDWKTVGQDLAFSIREYGKTQ